MTIKTIIIFAMVTLPIQAANTDDEIVKNLDFFQNIELIKEDNPFLMPAKKGGVNGHLKNEIKRNLNQDKKEDKNEKK